MAVFINCKVDNGKCATDVVVDEEAESERTSPKDDLLGRMCQDTVSTVRYSLGEAGSKFYHEFSHDWLRIMNL